MTSNFLIDEIKRGFRGSRSITLFAVNVTIGDSIMKDGRRLEDVGVVPDTMIGPTAKGFSEKGDPVLSYSAQLFRAKIDDRETRKFGFLY